MSNIWEELEIELQAKAKTEGEIVYDLDLEENKWIKLETLKELKQNYAIIPKAKLGELFKIIANDVHPLKLKKFVEELLK